MDYAKKTRRRMTLLVIALLAVVGVFAFRLVDIQVVQAEGYDKAATDKRSISVTTYGARGDIVDANGVVLADSVERYDITASPRNATADSFKHTVKGKKEKQTMTRADAISQLASTTGVSVDDVTKAVTGDPKSDFAYIAKSQTLAVRNAVVALNIPWVYVQAHPARTYPLGAVGGNLVGFIGTDGPQAGLEKSENKCVGSTNGTQTYERGADGVMLPDSTVTTKAAKNGGTLKLTIDSDFQWFVQQALADGAQYYGAKWATAIVVRVKDGHIMAAADYPSVDPNNVNGVDASSLGSRLFSSPYEPGSTFKAMTAAMLLNEGKITQTTHVVAPGVLKVDGGTIKDVFAHGTEHWTTTGVLVNSSNIGISILSERLDDATREKYMRAFGLGSKTAVGFLGESAGILRDSSKWDPITEKAVAFGQGVSATSAQVAQIYQTIGNGGVKMPLTLVEGCEQADGTMTDVPSAVGTRVVSKSAATQTVQMLENVVTQGGLSPYLTIPGYDIAAKTGTAQVEQNGKYGSDRVVSVAGFVTGDNPQYALVVTLGLPTKLKTSTAAAPTFTKIMNQLIKTYKIEPSTKPVPNIPATW